MTTETGSNATIAIVDDHRMFADGFAALSRAGGAPYAVAVYESPDAFLADMDGGLVPDLVILDLVMKQMNGLALLAALRRTDKAVPVLMLSGIAEDPPLAEMRALGANGYLNKSAGHDELLAAIGAVLDGETLFEGSDESEAALAPDYQMPVLGARQCEVLALLGQGAGNRDIAAALGISENTVKSHLRALYEALGANTRTSAVRKAQRLGLI